jgi:hypothetical protein
MEQPLAILFAVLALTVCLAALFTAVAALFPVTVEISRRAVDDHPGRALGLGVVNIVFLGGASMALVSLGDGSGVRLLSLLALIIASAGVVGLTFGLAAVSGLAGERLAPQRTGLARIVLGTVVLTLGSATPFVGWFGLLPYVLCLALGGFVLALFRRRPPTV